jgi:HPt (histidine-containing phosphotransfer) domain-containing protein
MSAMTCRAPLEPVYSDYADDPDFEEILNLFISAVPEIVHSLETSFHSSDFDRIRDLAHQLKGTGGGYGFNEASRLAGVVERSCKSPPNPPELCVTLPLLIDYLARIRAKSA